mgnify:CR=1 FL=1
MVNEQVTDEDIAAVIAAFSLSLMLGQTFYTPAEVWGVPEQQRYASVADLVAAGPLPAAAMNMGKGVVDERHRPRERATQAWGEASALSRGRAVHRADDTPAALNRMLGRRNV